MALRPKANGLATAAMISFAASNALAAGRSPALRDAEGYAIATCLSDQSQPFLKAQGEGWGSVVIQRGEGDLSVYRRISDAVRVEMRKGDLMVVHLDADPPRDEAVPVVYCGEIIDRPAVRKAIDRALVQLAPDYRRR